MLQRDNNKSKQAFIPLFLPVSPFIIFFWEFLVMLFILIDFVITVMVQCFPDQFLEEILYNYFDKILPAILSLDILITMDRCIIRKGVIVTSRKQIIITYIKSVYFFADILSLVMSILQLALNDVYNYDTAYNFIVFVKIIKMYEFDKNIKRYALKTFNSLLIYEIIKNVIFLALLNHVIGCFAYFIDYRLLEKNHYTDNPSAYWLLTSYSLNGILYEDFWIRYTYAFYFSTAILSGIAYGDLVPQNPLETLYICFVLLLPLVVYSYIFSSVSDVIYKKRQKNRKVAKYIFQIKKYLKSLRVKQTLENELITYVSFFLNKSKFNLQFLDYLAPSTKKKYLVYSIHSKFDFFIFQQLLSISPLTNRYEFRDQLIKIMTEESFSDRFRLISPPNKIKLYYVNKGICKRVTLTDKHYSDQIIRKQYACFYSFLTGIIPQKVKYLSSSFVIAQSIDRYKFLQLLNMKAFYELKQAFHTMKEQKLLYRNDTVVGQNCLFCEGPEHMLHQCKHLDHEIVYRQIIKQNERRFSKRKKIKSVKVFEYVGQDEILDKESSKAEIGIQNRSDLDQPKHFQGKYVEVISQTRIYYPQFNISP